MNIDLRIIMVLRFVGVFRTPEAKGAAAGTVHGLAKSQVMQAALDIILPRRLTQELEIRASADAHTHAHAGLLKSENAASSLHCKEVAAAET